MPEQEVRANIVLTISDADGTEWLAPGHLADLQRADDPAITLPVAALLDRPLLVTKFHVIHEEEDGGDGRE
jgi:hypothetical protein